jgi:hypothetical protein
MMTTSSAANKSAAHAWQARGAAGWLGLAASPTFALMGWMAANDAPQRAVCSLGSSILPIDSMTAMYVLMSLFRKRCGGDGAGFELTIGAAADPAAKPLGW